MHHATDHMVGRNRLANEAFRVDGVQARALKRFTETFKEPPGHTIHGCQHHGVRRQQRRDAFGHIDHGGRFDRHNDQVLWA